MKAKIKVFKAIADESRLRILGMLDGKTLCVCEIAEVLGLAQSTVSRHLKVLEESGLVHREKEGLWVAYSLPSAPLGSLQEGILDLVRELSAGDPLVSRDRRAAEQVDREVICRRV
ncbi:MAG: metalloregulator ArsR/SmtB family transcription factor [Candidatus Latescibacterota bacterium]